MCRLVTYLGDEIPLNQLLIDPRHSLYRQSWEAKEMQGGIVNADGFGFGWVDRKEQTQIYTNTCPIWTDTNLPVLSKTLFSRYWLANVRSATIAEQNAQVNIQPFQVDKLLFMHNGYINNFNPQIRTHFHRILHPTIQAAIKGNTDSEYIFALLRQQLIEVTNITQAILNTLTALQQIITKQSALLNLIIGDGNKFYILRHAINGDCPSLYFSNAEANFPNSILVASEALTESGNWQSVPPHSYAVIDNNKQPLFTSL